MKRIIIVFLTSFCLLSQGCSSESCSYLDETQTVHLPLSNEDYLELNIPKELNLTKDGGRTYLTYSDDTSICITKAKLEIGKKTELGNNRTKNTIYRDLGDCRIVITTSTANFDYYDAKLADADIKKSDTTLYREYRINNLPKQKSTPEMMITPHGLYLPTTDYASAFSIIGCTADVAYFNDNFIMSWIMYYKLEDLKPQLCNLILDNDLSRVNEWYQSSNIFYAETDNYIVAAKKLTYNEWCCYLCNNVDDLKDCLLQGITTVHK